MTEAKASTSHEREALKAQTFQRLHPRAYLERFLAEQLRPDGRTPAEWRSATINAGSISTADGSALVRLGGTTVVCGVKAEIAEPELDSPDKGFIVPNLDLPAICSPRFKPGPPTEDAQVLSDRLNEVLIVSGILPTEQLCIYRGKAVWVLYVDATCINYDGNVFDATLLAMVSALKNTKLPKATYNEDTFRTTCSRKNMQSLDLRRLPISMSFGVFDSSHLLSDPTAFEEQLLDTTYTITMDGNDGLISVTQLGVGSIGGEDFLGKCIGDAKARCAEVGHEIYDL
ncbi:ribosomal protein S5 domain 2-type protein [Irpex rosettiformis]|uniref:Ribosomal protein S5 domain 2-type protein n=1 Tax=Irpex rosettiformis TaxID=378272 RepID=A0ACB8UCS9_9APHY|nr:ribosomal protein S5 domain 2-type protein [Irpex rosettiformis]